ncbi:hypothetical protein H3C66_01775 [Patescibacteria group bacterium]|nr:hypothetical protein [Patescibacteria group bacterium]
MAFDEVQFTIQTHNKNKYEVFKPYPPDPPERLEKFRQEFIYELGEDNEKTFPNYTYNCHGLTLIGRIGLFASEDETENNIFNLLSDIGFRRKTAIADITIEKFSFANNFQPGDIVIYKQLLKQEDETIVSPVIFNISHTCTIINVSEVQTTGKAKIIVLSKFGAQGEFFHDLDHPFILDKYGKNIEIWSNSKQ